MEQALRNNDKELMRYQKELQDRENQLKIDEMKQALAETKKIAGAYKASTKEYVREDENGEVVLCTDADLEQDSELGDEELGARYDIAELITDNQILLNRVDGLLDGDDYDDSISTRRSIDSRAEVESLTSSLIDGLYKQITSNEARQKKQGQGNKKGATNYVGSKKQVVTYEKQYRPPQPTKPAAKSRLFEYEKSQQKKPKLIGSAVKRPTTAKKGSSHNKSVTFAADASISAEISGGIDGSLSSTQAQYRHMKAMNDIK